MVKTKWTLQELLDKHPRPWIFSAIPGCYSELRDARGEAIPVPWPNLVPMLVELVNAEKRAVPPAKPPTFREGMLVCILVDPEDLNTHETFEVLAAGPEGILCRDDEGKQLPFYPDEFEKCRIFQVGHVEPGWFGRKRWVYGVNHQAIYVGKLPPLPEPNYRSL